MTKTELAAIVAEKAEITKADAGKAVSAVFEAIEEALVNGDKVSLVGFGTFETRERPERESTVAFGEKKGTKVITPAHKIPAFKAGKGLKEAVK